jgi:hypothetical protein
MIFPRTRESGEHDRDRHMAFCPYHHRVLEENMVQSRQTGTAPNGRRNAYLGTCIRQHPPLL